METASNQITLRRILGKILQFIARKSPFLPGKYRALLQSARGVQFKDWKTIYIGEDVYFDDLYPENIHIGNNCRITAGTRILTHYIDTQHIPDIVKGNQFHFYKGQVRIGNNVFIGTNSIIVKPVTIGDNSIIGANAIVTKDVPESAIVAGIPAKIIGIKKNSQKKKGDIIL
jgi:acetyltransferase-like isoleucine patch superfamily enzyme